MRLWGVAFRNHQDTYYHWALGILTYIITLCYGKWYPGLKLHTKAVDWIYRRSLLVMS